MRLGLFDVDAQLVQLARAAAQSKEHAVSLFCEPGEHSEEILRLFPAASLVADWESLLVPGEFDVLVVGCSDRQSSTREELLRRAVQEAVPLVAVQPAAESLLMHELAMIQSDTRSPLAVWNESCDHPAAQRLRERAAGRRIAQINVLRSLAEPSRRAVFTQLARDAELLQSLAGQLDRVTALGPASGEKIMSLAVTFAGASDALIQWVLQPASDAPSGRASVIGGGQKFTLQFAPPGAAWQFHEEPTTADDSGPAESIDAGDAMLQAIEHAMAADPTSPLLIGRWKEACYAAELAEGAQQSLRRGRTIQLHFEEHSEEQTFKGVMAIGGCLVLLLILSVLAASAVIDALGLPFRQSAWWRLWPLYVLAPAVLLLAAQSLWRVFAKKPSRPRD